MPDATLSEAIKEAYASAPRSRGIVHHTLEIHHPAFVAPLRVVQDWRELTATLEAGAPRNGGEAVTFSGYAFSVVPPEVAITGFPTCVIEIDNVSREILANIELAMESTELIQVIYRVFLSSDLSAPQNDPPLTMTIFSIDATPMRIRATAGFGDLNNRKFPTMVYTAGEFANLVAS